MLRLVTALLVTLGAVLALPGSLVAETPERAVVAGMLLVDTDNDGFISEADEGAVTLVELSQRDEQGGFFCTSSQMTVDGKFQFNDVAVLDYEVWVWWSPGFLDYQAETELEHVVILQGTAADLVDGVETYFMRLKPAPPGLVPYPVRTGYGSAVPCEAGAPVPTPQPGPARAGGVIPPDTGDAGLTR